MARHQHDPRLGAKFLADSDNRFKAIRQLFMVRLLLLVLQASSLDPPQSRR